MTTATLSGSGTCDNTAGTKSVDVIEQSGGGQYVQTFATIPAGQTGSYSFSMAAGHVLNTRTTPGA